MTTPCIMLVDESAFFLDLEQQFLKYSDAKVIPFGSYGAAMEELKQCRPDLIFMDIGAPAMDGITACIALKNHQTYADIPIVMLYGQRQLNEKELCLNAGCQGVLSKPLNRTEFLSMGRKYLPNIERRIQRVLCSTTVFFRSDSQHHYAASMDISEGGMFLETDYPAQVDEIFELAFSLPGAADQIIEVQARAVWLNREGNLTRPSYPIGTGVEFVDLSDTSADLIKQYIKDHAPLQDSIRSNLKIQPSKAHPKLASKSVAE